MQTATFETLLSPGCAGLLAEATAAYGREDEFALGTRLRRTHPADLVAAALTQARLRARAADKFDPADAALMFFTADGYEQATRVAVARHRASRVAALVGAGAQVADLCCGIGGDLVELARAGLTVTGVEADPLTAAAAAANVAALGLTDAARVECADATAADRTAFAAVVCDPARRGSRGRVFDPGAYRPPWSFVLDLLAATACAKVAPGIPHELLPEHVEAEWVSERGEVKEAALWAGALAPDGVRRRATLLPSGATLTDRDDPGPVVRRLGEYLYEPDGAVIRAGLVTAAAAVVGGGLVDPSIAYVTSDDAAATPFARGYRVVDTLPYDVKTLRGYVRERGIGTLTVKKRGVGIEPEKLRAAVRPRGDTAATFVVTRVAGKATVIVADPLPPSV